MKYIKKSIIIEAFRFGFDDYPDWFINSEKISLEKRINGNCIIETLEGKMTANQGDWIIKGIEGELYPCKHGIFIKTYENMIDNDKLFVEFTGKEDHKEFIQKCVDQFNSIDQKCSEDEKFNYSRVIYKEMVNRLDMLNKPILACLSESNFMGFLAKQLYEQAPNNTPRKAEIILQKAKELFRQQCKSFNEFYYIDLEFKKEKIFVFLTILLFQIPEWEELNLSQNEYDSGIKVDDPSRSKFSFCSMYDKLDKESWKNDFIDRDAFIRNLGISIYKYLKESEKENIEHKNLCKCQTGYDPSKILTNIEGE